MKSLLAGQTGLVVVAMLLSLGCRGPWTRMPSSEPSFQGLLDAEREDARLNSKRPLFTRNRPGDSRNRSSKERSDAIASYAQKQGVPQEFDDTQYSGTEEDYAFSDTITGGSGYRESSADSYASQTTHEQLRRESSRESDHRLDSQTRRDLAEAESAYGEEAAEVMKRTLLATRSRRPETATDAPQPTRNPDHGYQARLSDRSNPHEEIARNTRRVNDPSIRRVPPMQHAEEADRNTLMMTNRSEVVTASHTGDHSTSRDVLPSGIEERMRQREYSFDEQYVEAEESAAPMHQWPAENVSWQDSVRTAIHSIESEITNTANPERKSLLEKNSRLLSLTVGDLGSAMEPVPGVDKHTQQYLQHSMQAWHDVTDPAGHPESRKRATLALKSQRKATQHLAATSDLKVTQATFCTAVESFGDITEFSDFRFNPGQEVLLYFEVDNFVSLKVPDGANLETHLRGSYKIVEADSGYPVEEQSLKEDRNVSRIPRRDYFMVYRIWMPKTIAPGKYSMKLSVEDVNGRKFGDANIDFSIGE
ncbi:MAG: hypothetical protein Aurels2KO_19650 [Aureliella sp.]